MIEQVHALVPAAGKSDRLGGSVPKQYLSIQGKPVLQHTLEALARDERICSFSVGLASDDQEFEQLVHDMTIPVSTFEGGTSRARTVMNGLQHLRDTGATGWALVHDAARPCLPADALSSLLDEGMQQNSGAILAVPVSDTLKRADEEDYVSATVDRTALWMAQTPQLFRLDALAQALARQLEQGQEPTDEAAAMEAAGHSVLLVPGPASNFKITFADDLELASAYLSGHGKMSQ